MPDLILSPVKPCRKCGACERYASSQCIPCTRLKKARRREAAHQPTFERAQEALSYDPETGSLTWRIAPNGSKRIRAGSTAGNLTATKTKTYREVVIDGFKCYVHQVAWLLVTGAWTTSLIAHKDGDGTNNAFHNLREATVAECQHNRKSAQANSSTGLMGVCRTDASALRPFEARIKVNMKRINLGYFETAELAHAAYLAAKRKLHLGNLL